MHHPTDMKAHTTAFVTPALAGTRKKEPAKPGTCARDRRALQQLALNVHIKHSDLT